MRALAQMTPVSVAKPCARPGPSGRFRGSRPITGHPMLKAARIATKKLVSDPARGSSQTEIVALSGSSKAGSETGDGFTLKRTSRS